MVVFIQFSMHKTYYVGPCSDHIRVKLSCQSWLPKIRLKIMIMSQCFSITLDAQFVGALISFVSATYRMA